MNYFIPLKWMAIIVGLLSIAAHLPPALVPEKVAPWLKSLPRNYPLGAVLMLAATFWFVALTSVTDLGEISNVRFQLMAVWTVGGVLLTIFVPTFLAPRGLGCLLLLAAAVIIDAAFLVQTPWRYVMTLTAYWWVVAGMILVYSPHLWRDAILHVTQTPQRFRLFSWPGVVYGLVLIVLGIFVYP